MEASKLLEEHVGRTNRDAVTALEAARTKVEALQVRCVGTWGDSGHGAEKRRLGVTTGC